MTSICLTIFAGLTGVCSPNLVASSYESQGWTRWLPAQCVDGQAFELRPGSDLYVLVFLGVECPVARQYGARLQTLANQFSDQRLQFIAINSNPQDSTAEVAKFQQDFAISFSVIKDSSQQLAKHFKATRTAEAVVVNKAGDILYQGRIDDQYTPGVARPQVTEQNLRDAIESVLAGQPVTVPRTNPVGCVITFKKDAIDNPEVTFTRDIAPLLWKNCYECHRAGEIGPFDISDYEDLQGWAEMIVEVMKEQRMPPWHADPQHGEFKNERKLPSGMIETVQKWIDLGMPYGDPNNLPEKPKFIDGWRLPRSPEVIVEMRGRPYRVPAEGTIDYQYFVVDPGFTEDKWVSASQIIPGAASVVHHAIVFVRPPDDGQFMGIGWLNAYVPGQKPVVYPEGFARRVPAGSKLVFQMHYTPSGKEALDITKIGLNFVDPATVTHEIYTTIAIDQDFEIPPHTADHKVLAQMLKVPDEAKLLAISPHMHLRGKSFEVSASRTDRDEIILKVPHYDFNWQHTYELATPLDMRDIRNVQITATFDNSKLNPFNPNPDEYVMWGDQTWEEMTLGYFDVAIPFHPDRSTSDSQPRMSSSRRTVATSKEPSQADQQYIAEMLARYDANGDGEISRSEVFGVFKDYGYWEVDTNRDDIITSEELQRAARGRRGN